MLNDKNTHTDRMLEKMRNLAFEIIKFNDDQVNIEPYMDLVNDSFLEFRRYCSKVNKTFIAEFYTTVNMNSLMHNIESNSFNCLGYFADRYKDHTMLLTLRPGCISVFIYSLQVVYNKIRSIDTPIDYEDLAPLVAEINKLCSNIKLDNADDDIEIDTDDHTRSVYAIDDLFDIIKHYPRYNYLYRMKTLVYIEYSAVFKKWCY